MHWILYTRSGCHLCEDAEEWLHDLATFYNAQLQLIDILTDPVIYEQYKWQIPVLQIGEHVWDAPLDEQQIRADLAHLSA